MRARTAAAFAIGFAAGVLFLALTLLATGRLGGNTQAAAIAPATASAAKLPPPATAPWPDMSAKAAPLRPAPLPALIPPAGKTVSSADRAELPNVPRLSMPLAGIDPASIPDTFDDTRTDHKHEALDIMAPRGTPVMAAAEGNVVKLFNSKFGGLTVYQFDNARNYCFYYAHLDRYASGLKEGMLLRRGDILGYVGSTGDASPDAPHLHFTIFELGPEKQWSKGKAINPLPLLRNSSAVEAPRSR